MLPEAEYLPSCVWPDRSVQISSGVCRLLTFLWILRAFICLFYMLLRVSSLTEELPRDILKSMLLTNTFLRERTLGKMITMSLDMHTSVIGVCGFRYHAHSQFHFPDHVLSVKHKFSSHHHPVGISRLKSQLPAVEFPNLGCCGKLQSEPVDQNSVFLSHCHSAFQMCPFFFKKTDFRTLNSHL